MNRSDWLTAPAIALAAVLMLPLMAMAAPDLIDVCHYTSESTPDGHEWRHIRVNAKSLEKHLDHGDVLAGNTMSGTTQYLDLDCNVLDSDPQSPPEPSEPPGSAPSPPSELVFAVAYSDMDPSDGGYNPDLDVLIAKLIDGPDGANDGVPGPGDLIITGEYPEDFEMTEFGAFRITEHDVLSAAGGYVCSALSATGIFVWSTGEGNFEQYQERSSSETVTNLYDDQSLATGEVDQILISSGSPSQPSSEPVVPSAPDLSDQNFIDVEADCS